MAVRQRFKPAEREAFTPGTRVEWLHGSHWRPGEITGPIEHDNVIGMFWVPLKDRGPTTRTISTGELIYGRPGGVRLPVVKS